MLLTFGGSDPTGLTRKAVKSLAALSWPSVGFRVMFGPGFSGADDVRGLVAGRSDFEFVDNPPDPLAQFRGTDVV